MNGLALPKKEGWFSTSSSGVQSYISWPSSLFSHALFKGRYRCCSAVAACVCKTIWPSYYYYISCQAMMALKKSARNGII